MRCKIREQPTGAEVGGDEHHSSVFIGGPTDLRAYRGLLGVDEGLGVGERSSIARWIASSITSAGAAFVRRRACHHLTMTDGVLSASAAGMRWYWTTKPRLSA